MDLRLWPKPTRWCCLSGKHRLVETVFRASHRCNRPTSGCCDLHNNPGSNCLVTARCGNTMWNTGSIALQY